MDDPQPLTTSFLLKRGTLIGAALGMLAGLILLAVFGVNPDKEVASIVFWRNCILSGAAAGFLAAGALAWKLRSKNNQESKEANEMEQSTAAKSSQRTMDN